MEIIRGKQASFIDSWTVDGFESVQLDIGTGDGRFVRHMAQACPRHLVIGIDACRENLTDTSRCAPGNALFVIANALALPLELEGLATQLTINFPWGSLLEGLVNADARFLDGLAMIAGGQTELEVRLNAGALAEAGWSLDEGARRVREVLKGHGFEMQPPVMMTGRELKNYPTTWAKRLAYGRDPRAMMLKGSQHVCDLGE